MFQSVDILCKIFLINFSEVKWLLWLLFVHYFYYKFLPALYNFTTDLQRKANRTHNFFQTKPAVILKTEPNLKNPFCTSLSITQQINNLTDSLFHAISSVADHMQTISIQWKFSNYVIQLWSNEMSGVTSGHRFDSETLVMRSEVVVQPMSSHVHVATITAIHSHQ